MRHFTHRTGSLKTVFVVFAIIALMLTVFVFPAVAEEQTDKQERSSPSADAKEERWPWRFNVNVYGWAPWAPVTIKVDQEEVADLPEDFDRIIDSMEMAAMFEVEIHKGPIGVFASPVYYKGKDNEKFSGAAGERRKFTIKEKLWLIKYGASYDLGPWHLGKDSDSPTVILQPYAGGLYLHDEIQLKVNPGLLDRGLNIDTTLKFNTPIIGLNTLWDFTKRWSLRLGGNYGGFHVDDVDKTWEVDSSLAYRFKMWDVSSKVFVGFRWIHLDYQKKEIDIDPLDVYGPLLGIGWEF